MNAAQIHLLSNHISAFLYRNLILLISIFIKSDIAKRIGYLILVLGGLFTIPTFLSGEGAEEIVEQIGRSHDLIHEHEELAETFAYLNYLVALLAAFALGLTGKRHNGKNTPFMIVLTLSIIVAGFALCTGESGGEISHPEIHSKK